MKRSITQNSSVLTKLLEWCDVRTNRRTTSCATAAGAAATGAAAATAATAATGAEQQQCAYRSSFVRKFFNTHRISRVFLLARPPIPRAPLITRS